MTDLVCWTYILNDYNELTSTTTSLKSEAQEIKHKNRRVYEKIKIPFINNALCKIFFKRAYLPVKTIL